MRASLYTAALIFMIGGALAVLSPKAIIVDHPGARYRTLTPYASELVTKSQCFVYGLISCGLGIGAFYIAESWKNWRKEEDAEERAHHHYE